MAYYSKNINQGSSHHDSDTDNQDVDLTQYRMSMEDFQNISSKIYTIFNEKLGAPQFQMDVKTHPVLKDHYCKVGKHAFQISSLLGHLRDRELLSPDACFQEWGCGKAELTRWIFDITTPKDCFLIDRSKGKLKLTHQHKENQHQRLLIDIKDLELHKVPRSLERPCLAYSKHLCGSATDMTLRCLNNFCLNGGQITGICIALCCHQVCTYERYINHEFLNEIGITREDFTTLRKISTWKIAGKGTKEDHWTGLGLSERQKLGNMAKRILDVGRMRYVKTTMGAKTAELVYYIDEEKTLENMALICTF